KYAQELQSLVGRDSGFRGGLSSIFLSGELGSVQHYSVLLAGHKLNSDKVFQFLCHQVNIRTLIYMFAEERTQLFDSMIPIWAHDIYNLPADAKAEDLKRVYEKIKPDDSLMKDLKERMLDWNYELPSQKRKIRATLGLISTNMNDMCKQAVRIEDVMRTRKSRGNPEPFHIDHVLPQSKAKGNRIFHSIGNLTLLEPPANLAALDTHPSKKRDFYKQCSLVLTKTLCGYDLSIPAQTRKVKQLGKEIGSEKPNWDLDNWDDASVESRGTFIYEYFCQIAADCWKI
ncbi:MAG: HNH endonuclease family protein, partial [Acidobacteriota bacterium]